MVRLVVCTAFILLAAGVIAVPQISNRNELRQSDIRRDSKYRELAIRDTLRDISSQKYKPDDSELIYLIKEQIVHAANSEENPTASIEAAARRAEDAVTDVTAAYTVAIFQSSSVEVAQRTLARFQNTVKQIVDFAKNGNFSVRGHS